jgi:hypothetical protein
LTKTVWLKNKKKTFWNVIIEGEYKSSQYK